jgi:exodeoxyribonuclease VII small subunit
MPAPVPQPDDLSFEDAMESLDAIVASLEGERLPLEEMVASYERGMTLLRVCRTRIETARQRVELITADFEGKGKAALSEFTAMETPEAEESPKRQSRKKTAIPSPDPPPPDPGGEAADIRLF